MSNVTQCTSHPCLMTRWHSLPAITRRSTAPPERPKSLGFQVARLSILQIMDKTQCYKDVMICHYYQSLVHRPCKSLMIALKHVWVFEFCWFFFVEIVLFHSSPLPSPARDCVSWSPLGLDLADCSKCFQRWCPPRETPYRGCPAWAWGFFDRLYEHFFKGSWVFPGEVSTEQWSTLNHFLVKIVFSNIFLVSF